MRAHFCHFVSKASNILGDFRLEYEYAIAYENDFSIPVCRLHIVTSRHIPVSSHELPSLPKTNVKSEGSENITGLKFKTRTQSRTHSPI